MNPYGFDRVLSPPGVFPQAAARLDPSLPLRENEILIDVERLNLDSSSFRQIWESSDKNLEKMKSRVLEITADRGKLHNPVTNSGGTLLGTVLEMGRSLQRPALKVGDRVATLVSLSLTPLHLNKIIHVHPERDQIEVEGHAILFESGIAAKMPSDLPESVSLSIFDVCGAPALASDIIHSGDTVVILGAGKAGVLVAAEARERMRGKGRIILLEKDEQALKAAQALPFVTSALQADLSDPVRVMELVRQITQGEMADLVVNCVNISGTEMASILAAKKTGTVLFFNMATNFQAAVLGAEGIGHETRLVMGNGYVPGHAELALGLVRKYSELRNWFETKFR